MNCEVYSRYLVMYFWNILVIEKRLVYFQDWSWIFCSVHYWFLFELLNHRRFSLWFWCIIHWLRDFFKDNHREGCSMAFFLASDLISRKKCNSKLKSGKEEEKSLSSSILSFVNLRTTREKWSTYQIRCQCEEARRKQQQP